MVNAQASGSRRSASPTNGVDDYSLPADYKPYVPVSKRRAALLDNLSTKHAAKRLKDGQGSDQEEPIRSKVSAQLQAVKNLPDPVKEAEDAAALERETARRERTLLQRAQEVKERRAREDADKTAVQLEAEQERKMLDEMERAQRKLGGAKELAEGRVYTESLKTSFVLYLGARRSG